MKTARLLLLVLLAVLLPLRGALAEVAHCAGMPNEPVRMLSPSQLHAEASTADPRHDPAVHHATHEDASHHHASFDTAAHHEATHVHEADAGHDPHPLADHAHGTGDADAADRCNLCSASCSATPVLSALPQLAAPLPLAAAPFPAFHAPAPSHASEGQERPPRSA